MLLAGLLHFRLLSGALLCDCRRVFLQRSSFEAWNNGKWSDWADQYCTPDIEYHLEDAEMTLDEAKTVLSQMISDLNVQRVRLDNLIVSEDWAGVHYWNVITGEDDARTPMDTMAFMHFIETDNGIKVDSCFVYQGF